MNIKISHSFDPKHSYERQQCQVRRRCAVALCCHVLNIASKCNKLMLSVDANQHHQHLGRWPGPASRCRVDWLHRQHPVEGGSNRAIKLGSIFSYLFVQSRLKEEFVKINSFLHSGQVRAYTCRGKCGEMWLTFITNRVSMYPNNSTWMTHFVPFSPTASKNRHRQVFFSKLTRKSSLLGGWMDGFFQLVCRSFFLRSVVTIEAQAYQRPTHQEPELIAPSFIALTLVFGWKSKSIAIKLIFIIVRCTGPKK